MSVVLTEKKGKVGIITINRPEVRNALNIEVFNELDRVLSELKRDEGIRSLVVTGTGDSFISGADINELLTMDSKRGFEASRFQQSVFDKLEKLGKPSIAAIRGYCLGGGLELALSCTFRIAAKNAHLGFPELQLGIIPAFGGTERLIRTIGFSKALELILFHKILKGEEAERIGLVNLSVDDAQVLNTALEWADRLSEKSSFAIRAILELFYRTYEKGLQEDLSLESALAALAVASEEAKEFLRAFLSRKGKKS